ncbi:MAG: YegP family protein [Phycisphaerales bacterium]|nr:YegP family protein [Phycisphaerales bacterium]
MGKYHVSKASNGQYFWNLRGDNGERILQSETYTTKGSAFGGISSCKDNSPQDERYQRLTATNGLPYFTLRGKNNEVIGVSEAYSSTQAREGVIAACKHHGPISSTQDDTGER